MTKSTLRLGLRFIAPIEIDLDKLDIGVALPDLLSQGQRISALDPIKVSIVLPDYSQIVNGISVFEDTQVRPILPEFAVFSAAITGFDPVEVGLLMPDLEAQTAEIAGFVPVEVSLAMPDFVRVGPTETSFEPADVTISMPEFLGIEALITAIDTLDLSVGLPDFEINQDLTVTFDPASVLIDLPDTMVVQARIANIDALSLGIDLPDVFVTTQGMTNFVAADVPTALPDFETLPKITEQSRFVTGPTSVDWTAFASGANGTVFVAARLQANGQLSKDNIENLTGNAVAKDSDDAPAGPDTQRSGTIAGLQPEEDYVIDMFYRDELGQETDVVSTDPFTTEAEPSADPYEPYHASTGEVPLLIMDHAAGVYARDTGSGLVPMTTDDIVNFSIIVTGADGIDRMRTDDAAGDQPSFPLADFAFNPAATTVQMWMRPGVIDDFDRMFSFMGDGANRIFAYFSSAPQHYFRFRIDQGGLTQISQLQEDTVNDDTSFGFVAGWSASGGAGTIKLSVNGRATQSDTAASGVTLPSGLTDLDIGHESGIEQPDGGVQRLVVWGSLLSNAAFEAASPVSSGQGGVGDPGGEGPDVTPDYTIPPQNYGTSQLEIVGQPYNIVSAVGSTFRAEIGSGTNQYPLRFRDGNGNSRAWIYGGTILSNISQTASWSSLYSGSGVNSAGLFVSGQPQPTVSGLDAVGAWDAIRIRDTNDFLVESCYVQTGRDDAIEVDNNGVQGEIRNCLFESMVPVSWTGNNSGEGLLIEDCILKAIAYPYSSLSDVRHFGPVKLRDGSGLWRARRVIIAVDGPRHATTQPQRMWNKLIATEGLCYYLNLSDTPLSGGYPQPSGGWGTGAGKWELMQGATARSFYDSQRAAWLAANRPYVPSDPRAA